MPIPIDLLFLLIINTHQIQEWINTYQPHLLHIKIYQPKTYTFNVQYEMLSKGKN